MSFLQGACIGTNKQQQKEDRRRPPAQIVIINIKKNLHPLLFLATASEDMSVYVFNVINKEKPLINRLQGHSTPVLGICWAYDESLLASSAADGTVIIWKRAPLIPEATGDSDEVEAQQQQYQQPRQPPRTASEFGEDDAHDHEPIPVDFDD